MSAAAQSSRAASARLAQNAAPRTAAAARPRSNTLNRLLLLAPALVVLCVFGVALIDLLMWSFYSSGKLGMTPTGELGWSTYVRVLRDPLYLDVIIATFRLSA